MFIGHFAVGIAGRRLTPRAGLGWWFASVALLDVVWPVLLLMGLEHAELSGSANPFLMLTFTDYPLSHSLVGAVVWAVIFAGVYRLATGRQDGALLLALGVLSHWVLDVVTHLADMPVLPNGPYLGLGLWKSVAGTVVVESAMFAAAIVYYARGNRPRLAFWILVAVLYALYVASIVGPPPPSRAVVAWAGIAAWLFVLWAWWADRPQSVARNGAGERRQSRP
jgi:membrane-bound metal-dependent hydrolase YbcI (DUF457 family)